MENWIEYLDGLVAHEIRWNIYKTLGVLVVLWLLKKGAYQLTGIAKDADMKRLYHQRKTVQYTFAILALLLVGNIWISNFQSITTFLGLLSAGIAIALKDIFVNIAGWIFIYWRKPFDVGDRIQIGEIKGDVVDLRLFQFSLLEVGNWVDADQSTGRIIHVPNGKVFTDAQANYNQGFEYIWHEQRIFVSLESDYKKAQELLKQVMTEILKSEFPAIEKAIKRAHKNHFISFSQFKPTVYIKIHERGIQLALRYLVLPKKLRGMEHLITEGILDRLKNEENIKIVYPISSIYLENRRGD
jgi:small-conductance mechanosensitive channel